jgi:uncharacterized membrane protein YagU involved in acid resistance
MNTQKTEQLLRRATAGAASGLAATVPMTAVMLVESKLAPGDGHEPAPKVITHRAASAAGVYGWIRDALPALSYVNHFAYGGGFGVVYSLLAGRLKAPSAVRGPVFGLLLWAGGYLGWLPLTGLFPSATQTSSRRNVKLVLAHLVWGATVAVMFEQIRRTVMKSDQTQRR